MASGSFASLGPASWARLFLIILLRHEELTEVLYSALARRFQKAVPHQIVQCHRDFDSSLGYPGEGPTSSDAADAALRANPFLPMPSLSRAFTFSSTAVSPGLGIAPVLAALCPALLLWTSFTFDSSLGFPGEGWVWGLPRVLSFVRCRHRYTCFTYTCRP